MLQRADEERDELAPSHGIAHPVDDVAPRRISDWEPAVSGQDECLATGQDRWSPVRVKNGKPQSEHIESALPLLADLERTFREVACGPILLQKDFAHPTAQD